MAAAIILLIGSGGREDALAWKLQQSDLVEQIYIAPGNGGTDAHPKCSNVPIKATDYPALQQFALSHKVNLVLPGPDQAVVDGIELVFRNIGIPCFCPSPEAARLEGSKAFAKDFMKRHQIPTAAYERFRTADAAIAYVKSAKHRLVIKADGLAAGKGVLLPTTTEEAIQGIQEIMLSKAFGSAGDEIIIEEFLEGDELSILCFADGYSFLPFPAAQDHKRIGEGDTGLNTGGMGTYCPAPIATPALTATIRSTILEPTFKAMRKDGHPFLGMLFVGIMVLPDGTPKVLEYNVRFGDPETQSVLALMDPSCDLAQIISACCERRLDCVGLKIKEAAAVTVVLASAGYPTSSTSGNVINTAQLPKDVTVFHAGTAQKSSQLVTAGGRVLGITAVAATLPDAVKLAYEGVAAVNFDGMQYRKDIAHRALRPKKHTQTNGLTYAAAGVSIEAGDELVSRIKAVVKSTKRPGADSIIGGFGGLFDLKAAGYQDPILVSGTDGVGTKLKVAQVVGKHDTIGVDLVAMCVNDLIVQGAEPLFFLDYFACSKLEVNVAADVVTGVAEGCKASNCALVGGETAEMPGLYAPGDYDLAGFAVGAVERDSLLPLNNITANDVLIGLASDGLHSNGFSLVRKVVDRSGVSYHDTCPWNSSTTLGEALLIPTRLYIRSLVGVLRNQQLKGAIKGLAHITGGGWTENIPRMLPKDVSAVIDVADYQLPPVFQWLKQHGQIAAPEMARAFNCGVGMVIVADASRQQEVLATLKQAGENAFLLGHLRAGGHAVDIQNIKAWDR